MSKRRTELIAVGGREILGEQPLPQLDLSFAKTLSESLRSIRDPSIRPQGHAPEPGWRQGYRHFQTVDKTVGLSRSDRIRNGGRRAGRRNWACDSRSVVVRTAVLDYAARRT